VREASARDRTQQRCRQIERRMNVLRQQIQAGRNETQAVAAQLSESLVHCLQAYCACLAAGDGHDTEALFRLVALWFAGCGSAEVNTSVAHALSPPPGAPFPALPTAKLLPLVWQLVARLEARDADAHGFQRVLHRLVTSLGREHPYHSLYQLLALRASDVVGGEKEHQLVAAPRDKVAAAKAVLEEVRAAGPRQAETLAQMEQLCGAYSAIALIDVAEDKMPAHQRLPLPAVRRLTQLSLCPHRDTHPARRRLCVAPSRRRASCGCPSSRRLSRWTRRPSTPERRCPRTSSASRATWSWSAA